MASILLLLEALIRCYNHELLPQNLRWKEKETKDLTHIIEVKKAKKASTNLDNNLDRFWSFLNDHKEETKPWKLAHDGCIWP